MIPTGAGRGPLRFLFPKTLQIPIFLSFFAAALFLFRRILGYNILIIILVCRFPVGETMYFEQGRFGGGMEDFHP